MLIKCPECEKEISDKSKICIHCGFPIYNSQNICVINGVDYNCENILKTVLNGETMLSLKYFKDMTGCTLVSAKYFIDEVTSSHAIPKTFIVEMGSQTSNKDAPKCPYCNSFYVEKITTGGRLLSTAMFGLGSSKVGKQWHCKQCGSNF